ncbi:MAG: rhomboid family intramembrane serine protease, partial [Pseudomonadota bacterium]
AVGHFKYLVFYLLCAIAAGLGHAAWFGASQSPLVGASGAVAGIIAAYLILYPNMRVWVLALGKIPLPITAFWCLGVWLVLQVYSLVFDQSSNVSWISHISGAAAGAVLILFFKRSHVPLFERGRRRVKSD